MRLKQQLGLRSQDPLLLSQRSDMEKRRGGLQKRLWDERMLSVKNIFQNDKLIFLHTVLKS